ncbi:MAG: phosphatidylserine decarboxylase [Phycisphaeraceae bacterium]
MRLTPLGKREWLTILLIAAGLIGLFIWLQIWWPIAIVVIIAFCLCAFFRDPERNTPVRRNIMVAPADGVISSIHEVEHFEAFGEGATCVRIFLSVLDVHINRSPCHGLVGPLTGKQGKYLNALNPKSAEVNTWSMFPLLHPTKKHPIAAVRQVSGMIARTIVCTAKEGDILQRGERFGLIKFGSTTELYIPKSFQPKVLVQMRQRVWGGETEMIEVLPPGEAGAVKEKAADETPRQSD